MGARKKQQASGEGFRFSFESHLERNCLQKRERERDLRFAEPTLEWANKNSKIRRNRALRAFLLLVDSPPVKKAEDPFFARYFEGEREGNTYNLEDFREME